MVGMRLGGIDPSILRELSGVYKPFVKAFKELISNSFDADAETVRVEFADDFSSVTVADDGVGMTPFEFRNDFTRIGGGSRRWAVSKTPKGRLRIGNKGIGFLALARYCERLEVKSFADRAFHHTVTVPETPKTLDLRAALGVPISRELLQKRLSAQVRRGGRRGSTLDVSRHYKLDIARGRLTITKNLGPVCVAIRVDCRRFAFRAVLDFSRLLQLADSADLEKLDDFTSIDVFERELNDDSHGTRIKAEKLKSFVRRELKADRRRGYVRNIASQNGLEQFIWHLSRCTPISYPLLPQGRDDSLGNQLAISKQMCLTRLDVRHGEREDRLQRPVFPYLTDAPPLPEDMLIPVSLREGGVVARGFLAGYESVIFPAEYRGITIRVRGVAIGDPSYLGAENLLTGANKAALSQITGEINVLAGLAGVDMLNPGRESFYEESEHYKTVRGYLLGEGEQVGGKLGEAIAAVLRRSRVNSALNDLLGRAELRRRALDDVSAAITHLVARDDVGSNGIRKMLKSNRCHANGLPAAEDFEFSLPVRVGGLAVRQHKHLPQPNVIDYKNEEIKLDTARPEWDQSLLLFDRRFKVIHKKGSPIQPIAELDLKDERIFVNWGHPAKPQMDERGFLRTALAWVLAKEAARGDTDVMMNLALNLLSFTTQRDG